MPSCPTQTRVVCQGQAIGIWIEFQRSRICKFVSQLVRGAEVSKGLLMGLNAIYIYTHPRVTYVPSFIYSMYGVLEYSSILGMHTSNIVLQVVLRCTPVLQYSSTPVLQYNLYTNTLVHV